jgi:hypothetical protein
MDTQTPWQPEQPGSTEPQPGGPYTPPSQPYGQQPGSYPPPGEPYGVPQGGFSAPPPAAQKKGGFNWLACCGISCGVIVILTIIIVLVVGKSCGGFFGPIVQIAMVATEVQETDASTIRSSASPVDANSLVAAPAAYKGKWLAVEGVLGDQNDPMAREMGSQSGQEGTAYFMEPNIVVVDASKAPPVGQAGDTVRAYGKAVELDLKEMLKFAGPEAMKEIENDPELAGRTKIVFVFCKEVELVSAGSGGTAPAEPSATEPASEWGK